MTEIGWIILIGIAYIVKGMIWLAIDCYVYKSKYANALETVISVSLWPIVGLIETLRIIRQKLCQR
jgi:hypothetical protein